MVHSSITDMASTFSRPEEVDKATAANTPRDILRMVMAVFPNHREINNR